MTERSVSPTELLAAARETLLKNGFTEITRHSLARIDTPSTCMFEDSFSVVAIVFYKTWRELKSEWQQAQAAFVELISENISSSEQKSWDGYLLLWTTDFVPLAEIEDCQRIQYDTVRVRKLISSGETLEGIGDVQLALLPLLPISESFGHASSNSALNRLGAIMETKELSQEKIQAVVDAFEKQKSLFEAIHNFEKESG